LTRATDAYDRRHRPLYDGTSQSPRLSQYFQLFGAQQNALAHDLPDLNFTVARDHHIVLRLVRVAPARDFVRRTSKTPKLRSSTSCLRERLCDVIEGLLDDVENILLDKPRLFADPHYQIPFCKVCLQMSVAYQHSCDLRPFATLLLVILLICRFERGIGDRFSELYANTF
jgi:hypothetical protein